MQGRTKIIGLLVILVVIAVLPLLAARYVFNHTSQLHIKRRNQGEFVKATRVANLQVGVVDPADKPRELEGKDKPRELEGKDKPRELESKDKPRSPSPLRPALYARGPAQALSTYTGRWLLIYDTQGQCCDSQCERGMRQLHQVRIAEHNGIERSVVALLQPTHCPLPSLAKSDKLWLLDGKQLAAWQQKLPGKQAQILIVDPNGWVALKYPGTTGPKPIYEDLRLLLHTSQIG